MNYFIILIGIYIYISLKNTKNENLIDYKKDVVLHKIETNFGRIINAVSQQFQVDEYIIYAIIKHESGGDSKALGQTGDYGLMQITQMCLDDFNKLVLSNQGGYTLNDMLEPFANILVGTWFFSSLMIKFRNLEYKERVKKSLAAYNAGYNGALNGKGVEYAEKVLKQLEIVKSYFGV